MAKLRRNAISLDVEDEIIQTFATTTTKARSRQPCSQTSSETPPSQQPSNSTIRSESSASGEEHYIRIGRRTAEDDDDGDIPTQCLVVARIEAEREKVTWLAVVTWRLNGLRIGTVSTGDPIREDEDFDLSTSLDPDPYFFARNLLSPPSIRRHVLQLVKDGKFDVQNETLEDDIAERERDEAQWARLAKDTGAVKDDDGDECALAGEDPEERFLHHWALPVALSRSILPFPKGLLAFDNRGVDDLLVHSINVIATFSNQLNSHDLRLRNYIQVEFEADETLEQAKQYFRLGEPFGEFRGLEGARHLGRRHWMLEVWVLPQLRGCLTMFRWEDVPELPARAFCDLRTLREEAGGKAKLYVEVRIVPNPDCAGEVDGSDDRFDERSYVEDSE